MTIQAKLTATKREGRGKGAARKLRAAGRVPGVVYGRGVETLALSVDAKEAEHLFHAISVENTIVDLELEGEGGPIQTLVREVQVHPIRPELLHIDFYRIRAGEKVEVDIPVRLNGVPEGVKSSGGVLQQILHEIPVSVLPSQIPPSVEIDVSDLELGDAIHVSDLQLDEGVEILLEPEQTVAAVVAPRAAVLEEEEEEVELELLEGEEAEAAEGEEAPEGGAAEEPED